MMITTTPHGPYPYAGVPWFSTPFGRDGIITALEVLWLAPDVARGVLAYLAATQATEVDAGARRRAGQDPARGARRRDGGAGRGAVRALLRQRRRDAAVRDAGGGVLPAHRRPRLPALDRAHVQRALDWIERYGDVDGDGFVEYARQTPHRPGAAGLEGLARLRLPRRRHAGRGAHRARRGAGATSSAAWQAAAEIAIALGGGSGDALAKAAATCARRRRCARGSRSASGTRSSGTYVLALDGAEAPLPGRQLERRARAVDGDRRRRARARARGRGADARRELLRLGHPHDPVVAGPLQPDGLSQRLGVAARQRDHRRRVRALRLPRLVRPRARRDEGRERRGRACAGCPS